MNAWPDKQGGAVTLIGALLIVITLALMVEVLHRMAASDILDTTVQSDSVEALFISETGIEHASYLYANGTSCADLSLLNNIAVGRGHFDITGSALVGGDCQIQVRGSVPTFSVQRFLQADLQSGGGNLLAGANADFNEPPGACWPFFGCTPTGWTFIPVPTLFRPAWDNTGGPDGSRAAYVWKIFNGGSTATTGGSLALQAFTVTAPTVLTLNFDFRVVTSGGSPQEAQLSFSLSDGTNSYPASPSPFQSGNTGNYTSGSVNFTVGGSGPITMTDFSFTLFAKSGRPKRIWLDNLDLQGPGGGSAVSLHRWREVIIN